jgi:hypothetical protein
VCGLPCGFVRVCLSVCLCVCVFVCVKHALQYFRPGGVTLLLHLFTPRCHTVVQHKYRPTPSPCSIIPAGVCVCVCVFACLCVCGRACVFLSVRSCVCVCGVCVPRRHISSPGRQDTVAATVVTPLSQLLLHCRCDVVTPLLLRCYTHAPP